MNKKISSRPADISDRSISLAPHLPPIPERLLLAHARGEVLFIAGAGVSQPANLPDFRGLVVDIYRQLDTAIHEIIRNIPRDHRTTDALDLSRISSAQAAEVKRFVAGDYDVVIGMLERRMDGAIRITTRVRQAIAASLNSIATTPASLHKALVRLSDRGDAVTIITTNFDRLFQIAGKGLRQTLQTYSLGGMPRPSRAGDFAGVMHIHGVLEQNPARTSELIVSDHDFGEYYLRRRVVPDFIYDAARLFHLVLVGYSANDPPMRYLLNAVAADGSRFLDLKERFTFIGSSSEIPNPIDMEDWKGRGITPIPYSSANRHAALLDILQRWADLARPRGKKNPVDSEIKRIVRISFGASSAADRDLLEHLFRRSDSLERARLAALASEQKADIGWLDTITAVTLASERGIRV